MTESSYSCGTAIIRALSGFKPCSVGNYSYYHKKCSEHLPNYDFLQKKGGPDGVQKGHPKGGSKRGVQKGDPRFVPTHIFL